MYHSTLFLCQSNIYISSMFVSLNSYSIRINKINVAVDTCRYHTVYMFPICFRTLDVGSGSDHTGFYHSNGITSAALMYGWRNFVSVLYIP